MRWFTLLAFILSFNTYSKDFNINNNFLDKTMQDRIANASSSNFENIFITYTLAPTMFTTAAVCTPFASITNEPCNGIYYADKIIQAQPDAASYIASNGEIKSVYLEQALVMLRKEYPNASDMELAKAILAY